MVFEVEDFGDPVAIVQALVTGLVGIVALAACVQGYLLRPLNILERLLGAISALALLYGGWQTDLVGAIVLGLLLGSQAVKRSRAAKASAAAD